jgi:hypothetical protein
MEVNFIANLAVMTLIGDAWGRAKERATVAWRR